MPNIEGNVEENIEEELQLRMHQMHLKPKVRLNPLQLRLIQQMLYQKCNSLTQLK